VTAQAGQPSRDDALDALPELLALARQAAMAVLEPDDQEALEFRRLLEACVVGAHRLRLREQLRLAQEFKRP
jgi:hypothetical protein